MPGISQAMPQLFGFRGSSIHVSFAEQPSGLTVCPPHAG